MHRARKVQAGEDKTAYNGILDLQASARSVCYMRHVVQSHVLWSVDYESLFGIWGSGCWKFSKTGFYPGGGGGLTVLWAGAGGWRGGIWRWS